MGFGRQERQGIPGRKAGRVTMSVSEIVFLRLAEAVSLKCFAQLRASLELPAVEATRRQATSSNVGLSAGYDLERATARNFVEVSQ